MTSTADTVLRHLESYGLRREGSNRYRTVKGNPLRPGSDGNAFTLAIYDGEHGAYYDHKTEESGSLYELAAALGIEVQTRERIAVASSKRAYRDLADYAAAHGISAEVLIKAGWQEVKPHQGRPAFMFKTDTGKRYRFIDGERPPYKSEMGYKPCWYGLQRALAMAQSTGRALVICNGEISTITAQHYGIPACCISGGEKRIPDHLLSQLQSHYQGDILVMFDCDVQGHRSAANIHEQLAGYPVYVLDSGLSDGGDLADFCQLHTDSTYEALLSLKPTANAPRLVAPEPRNTDAITALAHSLKELTTARKNGTLNSDPVELLKRAGQELNEAELIYMPPRISSFSSVADQAIAALDSAMANPSRIRGLTTDMYDLDYAIGGWRPDRLHVVYGATGMGKSTFCVSCLRTWIGCPGLIVPTESAPVPYLNKIVACVMKISTDLIEDGLLDEGQAKQARYILTRLKDQVGDYLEGGSPSPAALAAAVRRGVEERGIQWVVVDSVSKMKVPGADASESTAAAIDMCQSLALDYHLPFLVTSQVGRQIRERSNKRPQLDDAAGSAQVERNADVVLTAYNHDYYCKRGLAEPDDNLPAGTSLFTIEKHRHREAGGIGVLLKFVGGSGFYSMAREGEVEF
jgi:replicative DNA helicase